MKPVPDLTNLGVLEIAIKAEIDAAAKYRKMAKSLNNKGFKISLLYLENEENS
ncbi:MAG: hypothetical protein ABIJ61_13995 [bacterium]